MSPLHHGFSLSSAPSQIQPVLAAVHSSCRSSTWVSVSRIRSRLFPLFHSLFVLTVSLSGLLSPSLHLWNGRNVGRIEGSKSNENKTEKGKRKSVKGKNEIKEPWRVRYYSLFLVVFVQQN